MAAAARRRQQQQSVAKDIFFVAVVQDIPRHLFKIYDSMFRFRLYNTRLGGFKVSVRHIKISR